MQSVWVDVLGEVVRPRKGLATVWADIGTLLSMRAYMSKTPTSAAEPQHQANIVTSRNVTNSIPFQMF